MTRHVFLWLLGLVAPPAWSAVLVLENDQLAVELSRETGAVQRVVRKGGGPDYIGPAAGEMFTVQLPLPHWEGHRAAGSHAGGFRVRDQDGTSLRLEAERFATSQGRLDLRVELFYRLEQNRLVTKLRLHNRTKLGVDRVIFPMLEVAPAADGEEALVFAAGTAPLRRLFSTNTVRVEHDPFPALDPADLRGWFHFDPAVSAKAFRYPFGYAPGAATLATTWMMYRADGAGIGWDVRDRLFRNQKAIVERRLVRDRRSMHANRQTYVLSWHWQPRVDPEAVWESPEVHLRFDDGDWHGIAAQHRDWLKSWLPRPETPVKFRESLGWMSRGVTSFDQIPDMAQQAVAIGAPYFLLYGWFNGGMWGLSYNYHPRPELGGVESLRRNLDAAKQLGAVPIAWFNPTTSTETTLEHQQRGREWIAVDRMGGMEVDGRWTLYGPDRPPTVDDGAVSFNFDMGTGAAGFVVDTARRILKDYGFSGIEFDQGAKSYVSWSPHTRDRRPDLGYTQGMTEIYRRMGELIAPDGIILAENGPDFTSQFAHASWHFEGAPLNPAALTSLRYSLPWLLVPVRAVVGDRGHANLAFMFNAPLDFFGVVDPASEYGMHLQRLHRLKRSVQPLLFGGDFADTEGFRLLGHGDAVSARSYRQTDGLAVVVVNASAQPQVVRLEPAPGYGARAVPVQRLDGQSETLAGDAGLDLELAPYDVQVLLLEGAGS